MASDLSLLNESFRHHSSEIPLSPTDSQHFPDSLFNFPSIFETVSNHPFQPQPAPTPPSNFFSTPDPPLSLTSVSVTREGIEDLDALNTIGVTTEYTDYSRPNGLPVPDDGYMQSHVNPDFFFQPHSSSLFGRSNLQTQMPNFSENLQFEEDFPRSNTMQDDYCFGRLHHHAFHIDRAPAFRVEPYSAEERRERIHIYRSKRSKRNYNKVIKYECRKTQAESRARIHGKFARETAEIPEATSVHHLDEEVRENQLVDELHDEEDLHAVLRGFVKYKTP
ncbi:CCT domain-containing protein [Cinnamomum micranthum f. kanehirae]|uniref:CCT domain-containing protein n=1 Tax=Cinnamomum micranthum f. kanehirae TaxID=337451 RepID=A0A3S3QQ13_9MAGN|nr:CCT domain-containing protein [Cinnamomum micranthum f. kanehirae]